MSRVRTVRYLKRDRLLAADILSACASLAANTGGVVWIAIVAQAFGIPSNPQNVGQALVLDLAAAAFREADRNDLLSAIADSYETYAEAEALVREGWEPEDV